jgi:protein-S-isoprenylcysteine O-methyltransferase Ste14
MNTSPPPTSGQPRRIPRWLAFALFTIVWGLMPWLLSLLTPRYGWAAGRPGPWNLLGLIPLIIGIAGSLWTLTLHMAGSGHGLEWELTKSYLLTSGPYSFSRHPMYLFELTLILGWALFYGSIAVFTAFLGWWAWFSFSQVPSEEGVMEARFGAEYVEYKRRVPRWLGLPHR